jgi:hypothetical protein
MKTLKFILFTLIATTILSCSDNSTEPAFILSNESLAGDYDIAVLNIDIETTAEVAGVAVTISNTAIVGDTFQVDVIFNTDGTYSASGQYRVVSTVTPVGTAPITDTEIIVFSDSGSYSVNAVDDTITFMALGDVLLAGTFNVTVFNETSVTLSQQVEETIGDITSSINMNLSLERK